MVIDQKRYTNHRDAFKEPIPRSLAWNRLNKEKDDWKRYQKHQQPLLSSGARTQGLRRRKNRREPSASTTTERPFPVIDTALVTVLQLTAGKFVTYSKTWSAKLVAHV